MEKLYLDLSIVLFFLAALVILSRNRTEISKKSKMSFNLISTGICALALLSTISMIQNQLVTLITIPVTAIAGVEFIRLVLLISGLVFVTSGLSRWMPSLGLRTDNNESIILQLGQVKRLGRVISKSNSFDNFMRETLEFISENISITAGAVYAVAQSKDSAKLMASCGSLNNSYGITEKFVVNPRWLENLNRTGFTAADVSFSKIHPKATGYCYCYPMNSGAGRTFLYLLWAKEKLKADSIDPYVLERLTESLNARLATERLFLINDFNKKVEVFTQALRENISLRQSVNEMLMTAKEGLLAHMPVDYISICMKNPNDTGRRISIGQSGTILNETDVTFGHLNGYLNHVISSRNPISYKNIGSEKEGFFPEILAVSRIKSLMAIPLHGATETEGILTIGTESATAYSRADLEIFRRVTSSFEIILNEMAHENRSEVVQNRLNLANEFVKGISSAVSESEMFRQSARIIRGVLGCSIIRITTIDEEQKFLHSQALLNQDTSGERIPEHGDLILSLLKWHNQVQKNGTTVKVDGMPEIEIRHVFSAGVKSAIIVPIKLNNSILGMISLADYKDLADTSFTEENIQFVETIAAIMAVSMNARVRSEQPRAEISVLAKAGSNYPVHDRRMRNQLKSSLTSIIGSLDMIKCGGPQNEVNKERFLAIIDKSARKMTEYFSQ